VRFDSITAVRGEAISARRFRWGWSFLILIFLFPKTGEAQFGGLLGDLVDEIRDITDGLLGSEEIGSAYAAMINFAGNPDISAATYSMGREYGEDATLNVFRVSLRHEFKTESDKWQPFAQVLIPYQTLDSKDAIDSDNQTEVSWDAVGAIGTVGSEYTVDPHLKITPAINLGMVRLKSNAGFQGALGDSIFEPGLEELAFDWTAYAVVYGGALWADYEFPLETFEASAHVGVSQNWVQSYDVSDPSISFFSYATTLAGRLESNHPTGIEIGGCPISLVLTAGGTAFLGPGKDALGFDRFVSGGFAFQAGIDRFGLPLKSVQLGLLGITGPNVTGWSILFNYEF